MLDDLEKAISAERKRSSNAHDDDEIMRQLQRAGRDLISRQAIHFDDRLFQTSYRLLRDHQAYFNLLFEALGYEFVIAHDRGYARLGPGDVGTGQRRGTFRKDETMILFALRVLWEEGVRSGDADDYERVETDTESLVGRYTALGGGPLPSKARIMDTLRDWNRRGMLRLGDEDRDEENAPLMITAVIADLVTEDMAKGVLEYIAQSQEGTIAATDAIEHLQNRREAPLEPEADPADTNEQPLKEAILDV